jgi:dTDP-4-dehydrorhamnose reductase
MILATGANGQLGSEILANLSAPVCGVTRKNFDVSDKCAVMERIISLAPETIIHCAAYVDVDGAEDDAKRCREVNALGTRNVAEAASKIGAKMVYISTDYVFDGAGDRPREIYDEPNPINVYGRSKLEGENAVKNLLEKYFIVRVAWVFGKNGKNFFRSIVDWCKTHDEISVVSDQFGSPTYARDLVPALSEIIASEKYGTYHATNEGFCSRYEFALEVAEALGAGIKIKPVAARAFRSKARRPPNSRLSKDSLPANGFSRLPHWKDALKRFLRELGEKQWEK